MFVPWNENFKICFGVSLTTTYRINNNYVVGSHSNNSTDYTTTTCTGTATTTITTSTIATITATATNFSTKCCWFIKKVPFWLHICYTEIKQAVSIIALCQQTIYDLTTEITNVI